MSHDVFLTAAGAYLPGEPVPNNEIIGRIGAMTDRSERLGRLVLRQNKIRTRHYALNENGQPTHTNAQMAAAALRIAEQKSELSLEDLEFLGASTTLGDLLVPGHASAVHAELGIGPLEIASFQSVCASSMMAAKMAYLQVRAGDMKAAAVSASEFPSRWFRSEIYSHAEQFLQNDAEHMSAEFLRWTLSDGAGAIFFEHQPNERAQSFRVDWIDAVSMADRFDTCMYAGLNVENRADLSKAWGNYQDHMAASQDGAMMLLQDFDLLKKIIRAWIGQYLQLVSAEKIIPDQVDWLLCHYSAHSLREEIISILKTTGGMIDEEKWFTNLPTKGNTGSASLFIMLDEFMGRGLAKPGDKVLCIVPESGRAIVAFMMLTAL